MYSKGFGVASVLGFLTSLPLASAAPSFGLQIYECTVPGVIAPGFDDGPWMYSESILDRMEAANIKATWFVNGRNKGNIYDYNSTLRRMINLGHQIGSHTWSHANLATLDADTIKTQMIQVEDALKNILGYFPYYMRPPYLSVNPLALSVLKELEYYVIIGDLNTRDWDFQTESGIETAKQLFISGLDQGYSIVEAHDQEIWTQGVLIDYMISVIQSRGLKTVTVGECLGQAPSEWYRTERQPKPTNASIADPGPTIVYSINGRCGNIGSGGNNGWTCPPSGKKCCSKYGSCGNTAEYCAPSVCQPQFGKCDSAVSSSSTSLTTLPPSTSSSVPASSQTPSSSSLSSSSQALSSSSVPESSSTSSSSSVPVSSQPSISSSLPASSQAPSSTSVVESSQTPSSSSVPELSPTSSSSSVLVSSQAPTSSVPASSQAPSSSSVQTSSQAPSLSSVQTSSQAPSSSSVQTSSQAPISSSLPVSSQTPSSSTSPSPSGIVTPDGTCGNVQKGAGKGYICKTGYCCSKYGSCGTTSDYCAASVCQSAFGKCDGELAAGSITPDGTCGNIQKGANKGYVCKTGQCCSKYGNCGATVDYCGVPNGCQAAFGICAS